LIIKLTHAILCALEKITSTKEESYEGNRSY